MEIGLGHLGHTPDVFWAMSVVEFRRAHDGFLEKHTGKHPRGGPGRLSRAKFDALMAQFPDEAPAG